MYRRLKTLIAAIALVTLPALSGQVLAQTPEQSSLAATAATPLHVAMLDLHTAGTLRGGDYGV